MSRIILASASPQRKTLLAGLGSDFEVIPSAVDEPSVPESDPIKRALILAQHKAKDVHDRHGPAWVIGSDTLVVSPGGILLEKPVDADDARRMLGLQSGGVSHVHSGLALIAPDGSMLSDVSSSRVHFKTLADEDVDWWIRGGQWQGRSGAFQIDGPGQTLIRHLEGDWSGVVGFPVFLFAEMAKKAGLPMKG